MRRRPKVLALLTLIGVLTAVLVVSAASRLQTGSSRVAAESSTTLRNLPPGPPNQAFGQAVVGRTTLKEMIASAPLVFAGRVTAVGGSEVVSPGGESDEPELTVHRTRFDVVQSLYGDVPSTIDIAQFDVESAVPLKVGSIYVVFAEQRLLGSSETEFYVPFGYFQGLYEQTAADQIENQINGSIEITELARQLKEVRG